MADPAAQALHDRRALTVTLIVVSGAPGTGKSTIAAALEPGCVSRYSPSIEVDTGAPDAAGSAVTAVRSALSL